MAKPLEYRVLMSKVGPTNLAKLVRDALDSGWRLQGGVSVSSGNAVATPLFCQAVVRGGEE